MSMIGNLTRIPEDVRVALHKDPEAISTLLYPDFEAAPVKKPGVLARLFGAEPQPSAPAPKAIHNLDDGDTTDVDKAWHALHFLFTGSDWEGEFPEGFLVSCGEAVGDVDVGYGPAKSFSPNQVAEISAYLSSLDRNDLRSRLDPKKMEDMEIYPQIWKEPLNTDDEWDYIEGGLDEITRFVGETAEKRLALLVYIN